jgi:hypothetical protein
MKKLMLAIAAMTALAGCQTTGTADQPVAQPPANYRQLIIRETRDRVKDPYSIRSAEISAPDMAWSGLLYGGNAMVVCARFNAKNSFGAYIGIRPVAYIFRDQQLAHVVQDPPTACNGRTYQPFAELENIR